MHRGFTYAKKLTYIIVNSDITTFLVNSDITTCLINSESKTCLVNQAVHRVACSMFVLYHMNVTTS